MGFYIMLSAANISTGVFWAGCCGLRFADYRHPGAIAAGIVGCLSMWGGVWAINRWEYKERVGFAWLTANCLAFSLSASPRFRIWSCWGKFAPPKFFVVGVPQGIVDGYHLYLWQEAGPPPLELCEESSSGRTLDRWWSRPKELKR